MRCGPWRRLGPQVEPGDLRGRADRMGQPGGAVGRLGGVLGDVRGDRRRISRLARDEDPHVMLGTPARPWMPTPSTGGTGTWTDDTAAPTERARTSWSSHRGGSSPGPNPRRPGRRRGPGAGAPVDGVGIRWAGAGVSGMTCGCSSRARRKSTRRSPRTSPSSPPRRPTAPPGWPIRSARPEVARLDLRPRVAAMVRTAWSLGLRKDLRHLRLRAPPTPSATAGSSRRRACASRPRWPRCAGPEPPTSQGVGRRQLRLRRGVALCRSGLRPRESDELARTSPGPPPSSRECPGGSSKVSSTS